MHKLQARLRLSAALLAYGLYTAAPAMATAEPAATLRISAARTVTDTGIIDFLARMFRRQHPDIKVLVNGVGALSALDLGRDGKADLIVTHYPPEERRFIDLGYATERIQFMYSEYALFGPRDDTAGVGKAADFVHAFRQLRDAEVDMLVPSPRSGTYRKLEELWASAGMDPDWIGYENTGSSAASTLLQAADRDAYCFADMGLYLANRERLAASLSPLFRADIGFRNEISALVVNSAKIPGVRQELAERFLAFLISVPGQKAISDFNDAVFGTAVYTPSAHEDQSVINRSILARLAAETRQHRLFIAVGAVISLLILLTLGLVVRNQRLERKNWKNALALEQASQAHAVAQQADRAKGRFLAVMSHEIRTPLNAILGLARIGLQESAERRSRERFACIIDSGQHLLSLINDILDFSRIEAGKFPIESHPFQPAELVENVARSMADRARSSNLALTVNIDASLPDWVEGDPLRVQQILLNLLSNAIKFTAQGEVSLGVSQDGGMLQYRVNDTGIGISEAAMSRLFMPFEQADSSTTREYGGTGLGLAICRQLATLMHGEITVTSRPGAGSCFTLRLPLTVVTSPPASAAAALPGRAGARLGGLRILAAEDMDINRYILETILEREGASVEFAADGQQALEHVRERGAPAFDLVLMDVRMPVMDGLEATRRLLEIAPGLPVIGLTAHALAEERSACLAAGMIDHTTKPINPDALIEVIRQHVEVRSAAADNAGTGHLPEGTSTAQAARSLPRKPDRAAAGAPPQPSR